jgi:hypothetical protein
MSKMKTYQLKQEHLDKLNKSPVRLAKWVEALQSGEYKQGRESLYDAHDCTYCCLGVAERAINGNTQGNMIYLDYPSELKRHATFDGMLLEDMKTNCGVTFAGLNDEDRLTFKQIANLLLGKKVRKKIN